MRLTLDSLVVALPGVCVLLVLLALGLAVGAVPVDQHNQRQHEHQVRHQDGVSDRGQGLRPKNQDFKPFFGLVHFNEKLCEQP